MEDYLEMRYVDLRKHCKNLGLCCTGKKEQLIDILNKHFNKTVVDVDVPTKSTNEQEKNDDLTKSVSKRGRPTKKIIEETSTPKNVIKESNEESKSIGQRGRPRKKIIKEEEEEVKRIQSESPILKQNKKKKKKKKEISIITNDEEQKESSLLTNDESTPTPIKNNKQELNKTFEKDEIKLNVGRARIVKPIINGVVINEIKSGPKIIKPTTTEEEQKSKIIVPDFKTIHKKNDNKLESIVDNVKRINSRHESLTITTTTTPLINKKTSIPKLIPPSSASIKTPNIKNEHVSRQKLTTITNNNLNTSSLLTTTTTSSFARRKSFDINASMAKPLKYQPHTGKLKPINSIQHQLLQQQQQQMNQTQLIRRNSILIKNNDLLHEQTTRIRSDQIDSSAKVKDLINRKEKRFASQMTQRRLINNNDS